VNCLVLKGTANKIYSISSSGNGTSILTRRKQKRPQKLDYDIYLLGRPYELFKGSIRSKETVILYRKQLFAFCSYMKMNTEDIVSKYGQFIKVKGKNKPNLEGQIELQKLVEDYVLTLQNKVNTGLIKASTCGAFLPPVKLFCEMNGIILNWKLIDRLLPRGNDNALDEAYDRQKIQNMLEHCDLRARIPILFMASSGMRLGGFAQLKNGDIEAIYDDKLDPKKKILAAHVVVYRGTTDEYDTFITPEAWKAYEEYRNTRIKFGEKITKDSAIMVRRFNVNEDGNSIGPAADKKGLGGHAIIGILSVVAYKAGIREPSKAYNERYNIKIAHGFRKFFNTTLRSIKTKDGQQPAIQYIHKEWMMGHALRDLHAMEENYDRSDRVKILLEDYLKAVPELTINDEERLKVHVKKLETDISNMKTVSVELEEKDKQIKAMENKHELEMQSIRDQMNQIMSMVQQNPKLAHVKPEALATKRTN
jgi:integrase